MRACLMRVPPVRDYPCILAPRLKTLVELCKIHKKALQNLGKSLLMRVSRLALEFDIEQA